MVSHRLSSQHLVPRPSPVRSHHLGFGKHRFPAERLTIDQALRGFTIDAAWASFQEGRVGSLERGKEADFVVFAKDLEDVDVTEIPKVKLRCTVVGGRLFSGELQ